MSEPERWSPWDLRHFMMGDHPDQEKYRRRFRRIPSDPRCRMCAAPFGGVGGKALATVGFGRSSNPALCMRCVVRLGKVGLSGVEIPCTLVFSDVRGSTGLGERLRPSEFHEFLDRFYRIATKAIVDNDGIVDKVVGDEVIGLFFGGISGPDHAGAGIRAALQLADAAAHVDATPMGPIPVGTAVHTGDAFVGSSGQQGAVDDFTALGDCVNATARLASAAGPGELLVTVAAATAAHTRIEGRERRRLDLRGRSEPVEVVVLRRSDTTADRDQSAEA
jgi:adenylate cyclase